MHQRDLVTVCQQVRRRRERRRSSQKEEGKGSRKASQETSGLVGVVFNCHNCGDNDGRDGGLKWTVFFNGDFLGMCALYWFWRQNQGHGSFCTKMVGLRLFGMVAMICKISSWEELVFCPDRLVMVRAVNASWSRLHAILVDLVIFEFSIFRKCMQHLQNGKGGDQEEEEEEEEDECLLGESGYSSTSYSGYSSSTRTESISPHSNTREEPASQVRLLGNTVARMGHNCNPPTHSFSTQHIMVFLENVNG